MEFCGLACMQLRPHIKKKNNKERNKQQQKILKIPQTKTNKQTNKQKRQNCHIICQPGCWNTPMKVAGSCVLKTQMPKAVQVRFQIKNKKNNKNKILEA